ncbi:hypothetical protein BpHYR1_052363, partial [Brachionus plicatilis]
SSEVIINFKNIVSAQRKIFSTQKNLFSTKTPLLGTKNLSNLMPGMPPFSQFVPSSFRLVSKLIIIKTIGIFHKVFASVITIKDKTYFPHKFEIIINMIKFFCAVRKRETH